jgi:hypothetical protein
MAISTHEKEHTRAQKKHPEIYFTRMDRMKADARLMADG